MIGFIYAIRAGELVKLGWSSNPALRLVKIQADNPATCDLLGVLAGTEDDEAALHERFAEFRVRGEWFALVGPVAEFVVRMPLPPRKEPAPLEPTPAPKFLLQSPNPSQRWFVREWMRFRGVTQESLGSCLGISKGRMSELVSGKERFNADHLWGFAGALGIRPSELLEVNPLERA